MRKLTKATYLIGLFSLGLAIVSCDTAGFDEHPEETAALRSSSSSILMSEDFNGNNPFGQVHQQFGTNHAFNVVEDPRDGSNQVGKFELRYGDPVQSNGIRSEVLFPAQEDKERWYSYSMYVPSDAFDKDSDNDIISQWHQNGGSPSTTLRIHDDKWVFRSGNSEDNREVYDLGDVEKDTWHEFAFKFVHSYGSDGLIEVYMNGEKVLVLEGGNMYDQELPRWKVGIYKAAWRNRTTDSDLRVLYFDDIKMGDKNADLEIMTPRARAAASAAAQAQADAEAERKAEEEARAKAEAEKKAAEEEARAKEEAERKAAEEAAKAAAEAEAKAAAEAAAAQAAAEAAAAEQEASTAAQPASQPESTRTEQPARPTPPAPSNPESPNTTTSTGGETESPAVPYNSHQREEQRANGGR